MSPPLQAAPDFYRPEHAADWHYSPSPDGLREVAADLARSQGLLPASTDQKRTVLLIIDAQKDFCHPAGSLFVGGRSGRGAIDDSDRLARFMYRNLARITEVVCTLDTHNPFQIFSPEFWQSPDGEVQANREVQVEDLTMGRLRPRPEAAAAAGFEPEWLLAQATDYCRQLEAQGRYKLFLWPSHCLLGSDGHALMGVIQEARLVHSFARNAHNRLVPKGLDPLSENYSVFSPEVLVAHDGTPIGQRHQELLDSLVSADRLVVAGQAASHCVRASLEDLVTAAETSGDPSRIHLLDDCCSSVAVPAPSGQEDDFLFDFTEAAEEALCALAERGMQRVRSTHDLAD